MKKTKNIRRRRGSFLSPFVSITLVLFLIGLLGILVLYADQLKTYLKENLQVNIIFTEDARNADIIRMQKTLDNEYYVKKTEFISKEKAREIMLSELGEDAEAVLGFNPFPASLDVYFHAFYAQVDSVEAFKSQFEKMPFVKEIAYQKVILENIDRNVRVGGMIILGFMILFLLIAIVLINNTIRLTLYSQRFLIKTQQLVGATMSFITKPYIMRAVKFGIIGSITAIILLVAVVYFITVRFNIDWSLDVTTNILLGLLLIVFGVIITFVSSYFSVKKYLRMKLDDLY